MALNAARLATAIQTSLESGIRSTVMGGDQNVYPKLTAYCQQIANSVANAVISEITTNATVKGTTYDTTGASSGTVSGGVS